MTDQTDDVYGRYEAIVARRHLPSELRHRPVIKWPSDAEAFTGIPEGLLRARQAAGDGPRLVRIGRQVYVRPRDLADWIDGHVEGA
jgi:hypothetical protein